MPKDIKNILYSVIMAVLLIVAFFTGEIVTYSMLLLIYILLNNMYNTMLENQALLKKALQKDENAEDKINNLD